MTVQQPTRIADSEIHATRNAIRRSWSRTERDCRRWLPGVHLLASVLARNPATTVVVVDEVAKEGWGIGGVPLAEFLQRTQSSRR